MDLFSLLLDISIFDLAALVWIQFKCKSQFYYREHNSFISNEVFNQNIFDMIAEEIYTEYNASTGSNNGPENILSFHPELFMKKLFQNMKRHLYILTLNTEF